MTDFTCTINSGSSEEIVFTVAAELPDFQLGWMDSGYGLTH